MYTEHTSGEERAVKRACIVPPKLLAPKTSYKPSHELPADTTQSSSAPSNEEECAQGNTLGASVNNTGTISTVIQGPSSNSGNTSSLVSGLVSFQEYAATFTFSDAESWEWPADIDWDAATEDSQQTLL